MSTKSDEMTSNQLPEPSVVINEEKLIEDYVARQQSIAIQKKRDELKESFSEANLLEIARTWNNKLAAAKWHLKNFGSFRRELEQNNGSLSISDIESWFRRSELDGLYLKTKGLIQGPLYSDFLGQGQGSPSHGVDTIDVLKIRMGIYHYIYDEASREFVKSPEQNECPSP